MASLGFAVVNRRAITLQNLDLHRTSTIRHFEEMHLVALDEVCHRPRRTLACGSEQRNDVIVDFGELSCSEDLYIDGRVEGTIDPKGNRLIIGPNGSVKANVNACAVIVQGKLEGTIHASDRVDLKQSAIVVGDITTQRISIEEGAHLKGSVNIQKEAPEKEVRDGIALSPSEAAQPGKR